MRNAPLLALEEVTYTPPGAREAALDGLSLALGAGEFLAVLGADGAAREAVALLAAGLVLPDRGRVIIPETDEGQPAVGLVFPAPGQGLFAATVEEEVAVGLAWRNLPPARIAARTADALRQFNLWDLRHRSPATLSGGEKQRLAVAAALATDPRCLVLNDPAAMLDPAGTEAVLAAARRSAAENRGVLWITGSMDVVRTADRAAVLHGGRIIWLGRPADLWPRRGDLRGWGLRPPPLAELAGALAERGVSLRGAPMTPETMVEEICSVWSMSDSHTPAAAPRS
ncbi:MAG: ATP-binding cassette domain-containing protein [Bacteroidota bacterium]